MKRIRFILIFLFLLNGHSIKIVAQTITLDDFISQALENSPLLHDYDNQILINHLDSLKMRAAYGFVLSSDVNGTYAPSVKGWGYDQALTNGQTLFAGARVSKELINRKNLNTRLHTFDILRKQIESQHLLNSQMLKKQITDQYILTYISQQQFRNEEEIIHLLTQEDGVLKKLTQSSVFKQTDYLSFKVTFQQNQLGLLQRKAEWESNYMMLNFLCGITDTTLSTISEPLLRKSAPPFNQSTYRQTYISDSTKLMNDRALIEYDYQPKISAFSDAGYQSSLSHQPYKNIGLSVGLSVSIPIYDGHQKQLRLRQNEIQSNTSLQYFEQAQRQYEQMTLQLNEQIRDYEEIISQAQDQLVFARTLIEANAKQLPSGDVKMVDFILSINNYLSLKGNIIQYQSTFFALQNQLQNLIIQ